MNSFRQLKIIFYAIVAGQVFYFLLALYLVLTDKVIVSKNYDSPIGIIIPVIVIMLVIASKFLYERLTESKISETSISEKLISYRTNIIIKFTFLEVANLLTVTFYLLTADFLYIGMFIIVLGLYLINFPGKEKFVVDYGLSGKEKDELK